MMEINGTTSERLVQSFNNSTHPTEETHHDIRTLFSDLIEISERVYCYTDLKSNEILSEINCLVTEAIDLIENSDNRRQSIRTREFQNPYQDILYRIGGCLIVLFNIIQKEQPSKAMIIKIEYWFWHNTDADLLLRERN